MKKIFFSLILGYFALFSFSGVFAACSYDGIKNG